jgi:hypothetical protein
VQQPDIESLWENATPISGSAEVANDRIWAKPDMTVINSRRPPPVFPVEILGKWKEWVEATAQGRSAPVDYVVVSLLSLLSSVIGNSRWVSAWKGWTEPTILWAALIGNPSSGKSPAQDAVLALGREIEGSIAEDFPDQLMAWETERMAAKETRLIWEDEVRKAVKNETPPPSIPAKANEPEKPVRPRIIVTDATIESLARLLAQHPRGLLFSRDELAGWLESFNRYSGGGDRPFWIEAYGGRPYVVDRQKIDEPLRVPILSISVVGGIQPDKLVKLLMQGDDDGLASRILMVWPDAIPPRRPTLEPANHTALTAIQRLYNMRMGIDEEGKPKPIIVRLDEAAANMLDGWRQKNAEHQTWASGLYLSHLGKMPGMVLRLSLILEFMEWAYLPEGTPEPETVSAKSFASAAGLVEEYFLPMAERAYGDAALPKVERHAAVIAQRILKLRPQKINTREIQREWKLPGLGEAKAIKAACNHLVEANWIEAAPSRGGNTTGRLKGDFLVNPKVLGR